MKVLHLTLKKKFYDMIASGDKTEEYREIKPYWANRLTWQEFHGEISCVNSLKDCIHFDDACAYSTGVFRKNIEYIQFRNGYSKDAPTILVECNGITYGTARPEWSDNWQGEVFIIKLGKILQP